MTHVIYTVSGDNGNRIVTLFLDGQARWGGYVTKGEPVGVSVFGVLDLYEMDSLVPYEKIVFCSSGSFFKHLTTDFYHQQVSFNLTENLINDDIWHSFRRIDQIAVEALIRKECFKGFERCKDKKTRIRSITGKNTEKCSQQDLVS